MRNYDLSNFTRSSVGFEPFFSILNGAHRRQEAEGNFPPYDIVRKDDANYSIRLAVAGFSPHDITITAQQNLLKVAGRKPSQPDREYLYEGITDAEFERQFSLADHVEAYPDIPIFFQTSWYGHHVWATTSKYRAIRRGRKSPMRLLIGPWLHGYDDFARTYAGDVDFGPESRIDINELRRLWFDATLKEIDNGVLNGPDVLIFVMGGGRGSRDASGRLEHGGSWRSAPTFPPEPAEEVVLHLHGDGRLRSEPPSSDETVLSFIFDPVDPVPTIGGGVQNGMFPGLIQGGAQDQRGRQDLWACCDTEPLARRQDVLVFETEPFEEDVDIIGPVTVRLFVSSTAKDTDFTAKLIDVHPPSPEWPEGFAMNLSDSILRCRYRDGFDRESWLEPGRVVEIVVEPQAIGNRFARGHRLRLDISSSNFPRFDVNSNTGEPTGLERHVEAATNRVHFGPLHPSRLVLSRAGGPGAS